MMKKFSEMYIMQLIYLKDIKTSISDKSIDTIIETSNPKKIFK